MNIFEYLRSLEFLGLDTIEWVGACIVYAIQAAVAYQLGKLRQRRAAIDVETAKYEQQIKQHQANVGAADVDVRVRSDDVAKIEQRLELQIDRISELDSIVDDCKRDQSKASTRMGTVNIRKNEAEAERSRIEAELTEAKHWLERTKTARVKLRGKLRTALNTPLGDEPQTSNK
ncbi:MAG: hypothetical protein RIC04_02480 [Parvibaculum sp.]|uniref:hypothetical protein n=1 Tax=Parvibaculum sp. TaxID=2024848 RepID=UPI0032EDFAD9